MKHSVRQFKSLALALKELEPFDGIIKVAREIGIGTGTVQRIAREMGGPFADAAA